MVCLSGWLLIRNASKGATLVKSSDALIVRLDTPMAAVRTVMVFKTLSLVNEVNMTPEQIELARHALGLPNKRRRSYRNHFVAGEGHNDYVAWCDMVEKGLARGKKGSQLTGGDPVFWLTRLGAERVLRKGERLCPEDFPILAVSIG